MDLIITELAALQIEKAHLYYKNVEAGIGDKFRDEITRVMEVIATSPYGFVALYGKHRRKLLKVFPYEIFYFIHNEKIYVSALFHQAHNPEKITEVLN